MKLGAVALALWILGALSAFGAPFTSAFDSLRAELQRRHDEDYAGTLSRSQRKELAAIDASLARIDGAHATIEDDARSLRVVAKRLTTAFRSEFTGAEPGPLAALVAGAATNLLGEAEVLYGSLDDTIATLVEPSTRARVQALATSARRDLDTAALPGTAPRTAAGLVLRAGRSIAKALAIAEDAQSNRLTCKIGNRTIAGMTVTGAVGTFGGQPIIDVFAQFPNPVTNRTESFALRLNGPAALPMDIGPFAPFGGGNGNFAYLGTGESQADYFLSQFSPKSTGTITAFDEETGTAAGTFSCLLQRNGGTKITMLQGTFRIVDSPGAFAK